MSNRIVSVVIGPYPKSFLDFVMPKVTATFEDGTVEVLFAFYPDELSFSQQEFVGLTREEAGQLRHQKDVAYLRS